MKNYNSILVNKIKEVELNYIGLDTNVKLYGVAYNLKEDENVFPCSYWANTSSNSIVKNLIERADDITKGEIEALIEGKTI